MKHLILFFLSFYPLYSQPDHVKILPNTLVAHNYFGGAISYNGKTIIAGAAGGSYKITGSGYLIEKTNSSWKIISQIADTISTNIEQNGFGKSVSISDNYFMIGNPFENHQQGCAYICKLSDASFEHAVKLTPIEINNVISFGHSVDLNDNYAIVSSLNNCVFGFNPGFVYIYKNIENTWSLVASMTSDDSLSCDGYGFNVEISDSFAVVSATADGDHGMASGCVYVYYNNKGNWIFLYKIYSPDASLSDFFGQSISLRDGLLLVGSPGERGPNNESGKAYLFKLMYDRYLKIADLMGKDLDDESGFGSSVTMDKTLIAIGAPNRFYDNGIGSVYIFEKNNDTWNEIKKLTSPLNQTKNYYGCAIALKNEILVVGSMLDDEKAENAGAIHLYDLSFITSITQREESNLNSYSLYQNFPNPFNLDTSIKFRLPKSSHVKLEISAITGQKIKILIDENMAEGYYTITFNAGNLPSGLYFCKLQTDDFVGIKKMIFMK